MVGGVCIGWKPGVRTRHAICFLVGPRAGNMAAEPGRRSLTLLMLMARISPLARSTSAAEPYVPLPVKGLPEVSALPAQAELPDPLRLMDGRQVQDAAQWQRERRPELKTLFQHYMYGYMPPPPDNVRGTIEREDPKIFGGKATKREVTIHFGPEGTPAIHLLLIVPNHRTGPAPVFVGLNFGGNHRVVSDPSIALTEYWMPDHFADGKTNRASAASRGADVEGWQAEGSIDRDYALATFYCGDVDPDRPDFTDGVHPHYFRPGQTAPAAHDWGTIAAWAWGLSRAVDYLVTDRDIDAQRIVAYGHSRLGKTALVAAAFDERIALAIPHQAGCGGTAPSRGTVGESVERINTVFPHWFNDIFPQFNRQVNRLPFDQNCLVALVAPRPVLLANAVKDQWANPTGQFQVLKGAAPVYKLLGVEGLAASEMPPLGKLVDSRMGYFIRAGDHSVTREDWEAFWAFADKHLGRNGNAEQSSK